MNPEDNLLDCIDHLNDLIEIFEKGIEPVDDEGWFKIERNDLDLMALAFRNEIDYLMGRFDGGLR